MEMYVQHKATVAIASVLGMEQWMDFREVSMFEERKSTDRYREWNCNCWVVYITAYSSY
jgi:hypothetical protein